jgi:hypothetical protein
MFFYDIFPKHRKWNHFRVTDESVLRGHDHFLVNFLLFGFIFCTVIFALDLLLLGNPFFF